MAVTMGLGLLFYILSGFRYYLHSQGLGYLGIISHIFGVWGPGRDPRSKCALKIQKVSSEVLMTKPL